MRLAVVLSLLVSACGTQPSATTAPNHRDPATECAAQTAVILVADGVLEARCGCAEGKGARVVGSGELTCTVPVDTAVTFVFSGTENKHQIISEGATAFAGSPPDVPTHAVKFTAGGVYLYKDLYMPSLRGRFIVN